MIQRLLLLFSILFFALCLTGCFDSDVDDQSVPWGRPKSWEHGAPGFR
jgi:hypothetical protein